MKVGEKKEIEVAPEKGFGQRDAKLVRIVPNKVFKDQKFDPMPGMIVDFGGTKGKIQSVDGGRVRVDFNNPLAGHKLKYSVEVKEKIDNPQDQVRAILDFFGAKDAEVKVEGPSATINFRLPQQLKERVSGLVLQHVKGIEKVSFVESYGKATKKE
jgi:FKBP-type peptidyl-prolyl cis-trans isomerase 2